MKILILRSSSSENVSGPYSIRMDTQYADRVIGHLSGRGYCKACQDKCRLCRSQYNLNFSDNIVDILDFPSVLPIMLDDPEEYIPTLVPEHDILLSISIHEEILLEFIKTYPKAKGVVVPQERSDVISPNFIKRISEFCNSKGIQTAFPKPFCAFHPPDGILREFRKQFRIGKPEVEYSLENGFIRSTRVKVSAPCGATFYTCRGLEGAHLKDELGLVADKRLSAYPCTADHAVDRDFKDSITHEACKIQRDILVPLAGEL